MENFSILIFLTEDGTGLNGKMSRLYPILIRFKQIKPPKVDRAARVAVATLFVTIICWTPYFFARGWEAVQTLMVSCSCI
jgi:hypothetical protein